MSFQYALEFIDCSVEGKNPDIKGAISIEFIHEPPPIISDTSSSHGGRSSGSSHAMGNFAPEFIISDIGEFEATLALTKIACDYKNRKPHHLKITRYTVIDGEAVEDYVIKFESHYILISFMDSETSNKNHLFKIVSSAPRSNVIHDIYEFGSTASKMKSTLYDEHYLYVDKDGYGIIDKSDD